MQVKMETYIIIVIILAILGVILVCLDCIWIRKKCCSEESVKVVESVEDDFKSQDGKSEVNLSYQDEVDKPKRTPSHTTNGTHGIVTSNSPSSPTLAEISINDTYHELKTPIRIPSLRKRDSMKRKNKENQAVLLSTAAIKKHIYPNCSSDHDAERFSLQRNKLSNTLVNTVLKVEPTDFKIHKNPRFLCSTRKVQFWQCERNIFTENFKVETHAFFM